MVFDHKGKVLVVIGVALFITMIFMMAIPFVNLIHISSESTVEDVKNLAMKDIKWLLIPIMICMVIWGFMRIFRYKSKDTESHGT